MRLGPELDYDLLRSLRSQKKLVHRDVMCGVCSVRESFDSFFHSKHYLFQNRTLVIFKDSHIYYLTVADGFSVTCQVFSFSCKQERFFMPAAQAEIVFLIPLAYRTSEAIHFKEWLISIRESISLNERVGDFWSLLFLDELLKGNGKAQ